MIKSIAHRLCLSIIFIGITLLTGCESTSHNISAEEKDYGEKGRDSYYRREFLPGDVSFYVSIQDIETVLEAFHNSPLGRLYDGEEFQRFLTETDIYAFVAETLFGQYSENRENRRAVAAMVIQQILLWKGEVLFGVSSSTTMGERQSVYALFQISMEDFAAYIDIEKQLFSLKNSGKRLVYYTYAGTEVYYAEKDGKIAPDTFFMACSGTTALQSNNKQWLEATLSSIKNKRPVEPEEEPYLDIFLTRKNFDNIYESLKKTQANIPGQDDARVNDASTEAVFDFWGFDTIEEISFRLVPQEHEIAIQGEVKGIPEDGKGMFSLFNGELLKDGTHLSYVPANVFWYQEIIVNISDFWGELFRLVESFGKEQSMQFTTGLSMTETMLGIDIETDVVEPLGSVMYCYAFDENGKQKSVIACQLDDPRKISMTLETIFSETSMLKRMIGGGVKKENYRGHAFYIIDFSKEMNQGEEQNEDQVVVLSIIDGMLYMGDSDCIKNTIQVADAQEHMNTSEVISYYNSEMHAAMMAEIPDMNLVSYGVIDCSYVISMVSDILISDMESKKEMSEMYKRWRDEMRESGEEVDEYINQCAEQPLFYFDKSLLPSSEYFSRFLDMVIISITRKQDTLVLSVSIGKDM